MQSKPLIVGITGGIGSGKSTICKIFETLCHKIYYADDRAKWLMNNSNELKSQIMDLFGESAYSDNLLNREFIGEQVFKNSALLEKLNAKVHPAVREDSKNWVENNADEELLFYEAALIFEVGSYKRMDATILVTASEELRLKRVLARDTYRSEGSIKQIMSKQMSDAEKIPLADYLIINDEKNAVIKQTMDIYDQLLNRHK
ncbi:MAG: dephospho-CoA kinase [Ekhidna sp.]|nr:dephospho-CoA kinase [Ekhidna sp.]MBC6410056.1 dephospho-CoA kinase [Ekhidna sp.]MBC6427522.1 dephospho-CoA kinase [Ekhidna sp.]